MRKVRMQEVFFANQDEWYYFLTEVGVKKERLCEISEIEIIVDEFNITETY